MWKQSSKPEKNQTQLQMEGEKKTATEIIDMNITAVNAHQFICVCSIHA